MWSMFVFRLGSALENLWNQIPRKHFSSASLIQIDDTPYFNYRYLYFLDLLKWFLAFNSKSSTACFCCPRRLECFMLHLAVWDCLDAITENPRYSCPASAMFAPTAVRQCSVETLVFTVLNIIAKRFCPTHVFYDKEVVDVWRHISFIHNEKCWVVSTKFKCKLLKPVCVVEWQ